MQMHDVIQNTADQDRGADLNLVSPFDGTPTGMVFTIVGPDSETARRADLAFVDELAEAADTDGRVIAEARQRARLNALARRVIRWDVREDDEPVKLTTQALLTLLAVGWVRDQVDAFAGDHRNFKPGA
jgi:hypothetical protein